jgi:4-aminobutyrate aminotransferase
VSPDDVGTEANEAALPRDLVPAQQPGLLATATTAAVRTIATTANRSWSPTSLSACRCRCAGGYRLRSLFHTPTTRMSPAQDLRDVIDMHEGDVACMIAEPIQGVGGRDTARRLLRRHAEGARRLRHLVIADEVQTGFGRTGETWGYQVMASS